MYTRHFDKELGLEVIIESGIQNRTDDGIEDYDYYEDRHGNEMVRYCYTHYNGDVYECTGDSLEECREMKNDWLYGY